METILEALAAKLGKDERERLFGEVVRVTDRKLTSIETKGTATGEELNVLEALRTPLDVLKPT